MREGNDLFSDELILLDEKLSGNLFCAEKIVVEQNGILSGNIISKLCVVSGTVNGNIVSADQMEIKSTAVIKGEIKSALINIEPGAVINGAVTIAKDTNVIAKLSEKINKYSSSEYLNARLAAEAELNQLIDSSVNVVTRQQEVSKNIPIQAIKIKEPHNNVAPPVKPVAPAPKSKAAEPKDNKPEEGGSQRWW